MTVQSAPSVLLLLVSYSLSATAASPVNVTADSGIANPRQPQAAVDEQGVVYVAFGAGEAVYCAVSSDRGNRFDKPTKIGSVKGLALGMRRGPRVAAGHGVVVVSAISHELGDLFSWRSTNGGKTWHGPLRVNDSPRDAREGMHAMAMGPSGQLFCTWLDLRSGKTELYGARSIDRGASWSENWKIYTSPSGSVCECCHPSATYDGEGALHVMWRNSIDGARDMFLATSTDGGLTFSPAEKLGSGSWLLNACPMDGGSLAATTAGEVTTVWRRDQQLYRTRVDGRIEEQLGPGMQPWAAATASGTWLTWISRRGGDLWLLAPRSQQPEKLAAAAYEPVIATGTAREDSLVVFWEAGTVNNTAIMSTVVTDQ
jgi:hypothetical protein